MQPLLSLFAGEWNAFGDLFISGSRTTGFFCRTGLSAYGESDFLWARGYADFQTEPIALEFRHLMSKVIIYLKSDAMIPGDMIGGEVRILGSVINAKIDLNEGTVIAEGGTGQVVAADEVMKKDGFEIAVKAIIVPQTLKKGVKWLDIKLWEVILILVNCRKILFFSRESR